VRRSSCLSADDRVFLCKRAGTVNSSLEYFDDAHDRVRQRVREFVERRVKPFVDAWEEKGEFPEDLYHQASEAGVLGVGYPERYGGTGGDLFAKIACVEELMRCGSAGVVAGLGSLDISIPPILFLGTEEQKLRFVPPVLKGNRISALGVTEPAAGSDVAAISTTAVREGDHYVVHGGKIFITSGFRADQLTCAVRTGGEGYPGISLLVIESGRPGYSVSKKLEKMGWLASDTAQIFFDGCRVPVLNLIGEEGKGFYAIMENFQNERLHLSIMANMTAQLALEESLTYVREKAAPRRRAPMLQATHHRLADMATLVEASREFVYRVAAKMNSGQRQIKEISMAKNFSSMVSDYVTGEAIQIHGRQGCLRRSLVERLCRDNRILSIGGGTREIMKEVIWKLM
jgi:acyl-CoA dehydrogenase